MIGDQDVIGEPFSKGFDPRRHVGAPAIGRVFTSYLNELGMENEDGTAKYPLAELKNITQDPKSSHPKVMAAEDIMKARSKGFDKNNRIPKAADSLNRMCDRTVGKPVQSVMIAQVDTPNLTEMRAELVDLIAQNPDARLLLESLGAKSALPDGLIASIESGLDRSKESTPSY